MDVRNGLEECIDKERNLLVLCIDKIEHFPYKIKSNLRQTWAVEMSHQERETKRVNSRDKKGPKRPWTVACALW